MEDFLTDPDSVDANWRSTFQQLPGTESNRINSTLKRVNISAAWRKTLHVTLQRSPTLTPMGKQVKVLQLINAYRFRGHQHANLDPLGLWQQDKVADLDPSFHDLTEADFQEIFNVGSFASGKGNHETRRAAGSPQSKPTVARLVPSICTLPAPKKNAGSEQRIESGRADFQRREKRFLSRTDRR